MTDGAFGIALKIEPSDQMDCVYCVVVVLRPRLTTMVMSGRSVNLTTLFLGQV